jgi:glycine reductase
MDSNSYDVLSGTPEVVAYNDAVRKAGQSTAVYLASTVADQQPEDLVTYDTSLVDGCGELPRVVYFLQGRPYVYGETMRTGSGGPGHLPTFIDPNEVFDGAVTNSWIGPACHRDVTYLIQNHPVIEELYRRHGKSIDFAGVVIYDRGHDAHRKERNAYYACKLASLAKADGAILTYLGSGHSIVDVMMIIEILEKRGVRTVPLLPEMAADPKESGLVDFVPEAKTIVSTGNYELPIEIPAVDKVLGGDTLLETGEDAAGPLTVTLRSLLASTDPYGFAALRAMEW